MSRTWSRWLAGGATLVAVGAIVPLIAAAQDDDGYDGYIQSGTCAEPTDALRVSLDGEGDRDITPYLARTGVGDETVVLGYYGAPGVPGFGFSAIYSTDRAFSLVITDIDGEPAACGDLLEPDAERFGRAGVAVAQLLPTGESDVNGVAVIERAPLERELDVTPARVRVLLASGADITPVESAAGFDGYVQGGSCADPGDRVRVQLAGGSDHDVEPFLAQPSGTNDQVTVAYAGAAGAPGFGLAAAYTDQVFSLVIADTSTAEPVACGDILEPDDDNLTNAGLALVQLRAVADTSVLGFALIERVALERELDVTPTRVRIVLFAPPVTI